ncbi:MAG: hypothetical protein BWK76_25180 [Desulfobulbaceae bacterium A2]|nr:MAG: hypothetical protein BWK76_25180 [Desulfobulbaceae bacterium A2]
MPTVGIAKTERIDVRVNPPVKRLFQEAALACHKSVSEFLLDAGINAANQTLADRHRFLLEDEQWEAFLQALDRPASDQQQLRRLMNEPGILD